MKAKFKVGDKVTIYNERDAIIEMVDNRIEGVFYMATCDDGLRWYEEQKAFKLSKPDHSTEGTISFKTPDNWKEKESMAIETVEEAALKYEINHIVVKCNIYEAFKAGAEWRDKKQKEIAKKAFLVGYGLCNEPNKHTEKRFEIWYKEKYEI